jgi:hypothetical protein
MRRAYNPRIAKLRQYILPGLTILCSLSWLVISRRDEPNAAAASVGGQEAAKSDALVDLNKAFREAYAGTRKDFLGRSGPVILVEGDDLVLLRDGKRTSARVIPDVYHTLKAISHVPLSIFVILPQKSDSPLGDELSARLRNYRKRVVQAQSSLADKGLTELQLHRQEEIVAASLKFIDQALENQRSNVAETTAFARKMAPLVLANASDSADAELTSLHKQVQKWKAEMAAEEWKNLHVVVMGSALPRQGNLALQYFARLLGEKGEGERIIYAESLFDEARALNLLGTHLLDREIGVAFFDDPRRMHRDLLSDAAGETIKKMTFGP